MCIRDSCVVVPLMVTSATAFSTVLVPSAASALIGIMISATASDKIMEKILFVRKLFLVNFFLLPFFISMSSNLPLQAGHFLLGYRLSLIHIFGFFKRAFDRY